MRVVVALGGNALLKRGEPMTAEVQRANVRVAAQALAPVAREHELVITHGNGPQVGLLALQAQAYTAVEPYPLDVLGAETEGMIGYMLEQELGNLLPFEVPLATLLTMVEVDPADPAFGDPTKFVGPVYERADADRLAAGEGLDVQAGRRQVAPGRSLPAAEADLRDPADQVAAGEGHHRHLRRRRRHPDRLRARRHAHARRHRGGDRQGSGQRAAGARARRRPLRHGDRRRRRLPRLRARPTSGVLGRVTAAELKQHTVRRPGRWGRRWRPRSSSSRRPASGPPSAPLHDIEGIVAGEKGTNIVPN